MRNVIIIVLMMGMIFVGWNYSSKVPALQKAKLKKSIELAEKYEDEGFYLDAILEYKKALEIEDRMEWKKRIVLNYLAMEDYKSFKDEAVEYLKTYDDEEIYVDLISYMFEVNDKQAATKYIAQAEERYPDSETISDLHNKMNGQFSLSYTDYTDVGEYRDGFMVAKIEDETVLVNAKGKNAFQNTFSAVCDVKSSDELNESILSDSETSVIEESILASGSESGSNEIKAFDEDGYVRAADSDGLEYMGVMHDGKKLIQINGKWGYLDVDEDVSEATCIYDDATVFDNGVAAVKQNDKWALIDAEEKQITDYIYDDVYMDDLKNCSRGEAIFVKQSGEDSYSLINLKGKVLSEDKFDNVKGFLGSSGTAAVEVNGKWGAVDKAGTLKLGFEYDELGSSVTDYIPYKDNEEWGYINSDGVILIEPQFSDARAVNDEGYGMVSERGTWETITVYSIRGDEGLFD